MKSDQPFHSLTQDAVLDSLRVVSGEGLSSPEVNLRRQQHGPNELETEQIRHWGQIVLQQFKSVVIVIMIVAAVFALVTGRFPEAIALLAVTLINAAIGFFTEFSAVRSMEALRRLGRQYTTVIREGKRQRVLVRELVPGDIVALEEDLVPADVRLLGDKEIRVNEAALTGESVPVHKNPTHVDAKSPLYARHCMVYKGTSVVKGTSIGVVVATGSATELGRIAELTRQAHKKATPLQQRLDQLGRRMACITLSLAFVVGVAGLYAGQEPVLMIETAIALGIAAIPEGLPIVATIALARGMWLLARNHALMNSLPAVETLGATSVVFTDKTGTLTENKMVVKQLITPKTSANRDNRQDLADSGHAEAEISKKRLLAIGVLCSSVQPDHDLNNAYRGDPTEIALVQAAEQAGMTCEELRAEMEEVREVPFDSRTMMMATIHVNREQSFQKQQYYVAVKGAPAKVLEHCSNMRTSTGIFPLTDTDKANWKEQVTRLAGEGLRVLAFAESYVDDPELDPYAELSFVGLAALEDPPREDVKESIMACRHAGIRVIMVTGDSAETGGAIGKQVGLQESGDARQGSELPSNEKLADAREESLFKARVFARVTPEQKYQLVCMYQNNGDIVAMTGDGVNDTPALKQADIGVAMGLKGTDAAKQVADMVLLDDSFSTIVAAIREGRIIFANIRKSVMFMLCTNFAEVLVVTLASLANAPIPLKPLQILFLNVLTDVFPAMALAVGSSAINVMKRPPRPAEESILTRYHWLMVAGWSGVLGVAVLAGLAAALLVLGYPEQQAVTVSFLTLAFAKLVFVLNLRDPGTTIFHNDIVSNYWMWGAWGGCASLLFVAVYWPPLANLLQTTAPGITGWLLITILIVFPVLVGLVFPDSRLYSASSGKPASTD
ncbi:cation-translocating P-type ATPase [Desulfogranum japonicum]|uniref:cation-translocating P-type ATPase n=1 Tax=Desulfogranum japonicum TaxID=231447 RepID=UPI0003F4F841|nr:cation-transporting P-type ATPase [Desulfogranum japonicum]